MNGFFDKLDRLENAKAVCAIRDGLINIIPVIMLGAFSLALKSLPVGAYQAFLSRGTGAALASIFDFTFDATYGMLSVYMTISVAYSRASLRNDGGALMQVLTSLVTFFILVGTPENGVSVDVLGATSMFTALFSALTAPAVYERLEELFRNLGRRLGILPEEGSELNFALNAIFPVAASGLLFALVNRVIFQTTGAAGFNDLFQKVMTGLFRGLPNMGLSGFLFILVSSVLWCFGLHGSNILEGVSSVYFVPAAEANAQAVAAGLAAPHIVSKSFMDVFVLMGGCGSTICLLIALLLFSRNKSSRRLAVLSVVPGVFNINEPLVFGLSVIYNPIMMLPFILVPLLNYLTAYTATALGFLPVVCRTVEWTTPPLFSGWYATGSAAGTAVQAVCILIGVLVYLPFVKAYERSVNAALHSEYDGMVRALKESEASNSAASVFLHRGRTRRFCRMLTEELTAALSQGRVNMYYQPQYDNQRRLVGMEALLRWNHTVFGMVYPPLIIKLAEAGGIQFETERYAWETALADYAEMRERTGRHVDLSLNTTVGTLVDPRFVGTLTALAERYGIPCGEVCVEITEQSELSMSDVVLKTLSELREKGFLLSIDDFSMGFTSVKYLQEDFFNEVKLDGALTRNVVSNRNSQEIISSITKMADALHFSVIAEYVETEEQLRKLEEIGCVRYQGWLFSKAVGKDEMIHKLSLLAEY